MEMFTYLYAGSRASAAHYFSNFHLVTLDCKLYNTLGVLFDKTPKNPKPEVSLKTLTKTSVKPQKTKKTKDFQTMAKVDHPEVHVP